MSTLLASLLVGIGSDVKTLSNSGTAGGTIKYVNLGGLKLLWAQSGVVGSSSSAPQYTFNLPASFFTTVQMALAVPSNMTITATQYANVAAISPTLISASAVSTSAAGQILNLFAIGT